MLNSYGFSWFCFVEHQGHTNLPGSALSLPSITSGKTFEECTRQLFYRTTRLRYLNSVSIKLYPNITALFDRNRSAVHSIAIYGRLCMAECRQRSNLRKCIFTLDSKVWLTCYAAWLHKYR